MGEDIRFESMEQWKLWVVEKLAVIALEAEDEKVRECALTLIAALPGLEPRTSPLINFFLLLGAAAQHDERFAEIMPREGEVLRWMGEI